MSDYHAKWNSSYRVNQLELDMIDFEFVERCDDIRVLKRAIDLLKNEPYDALLNAVRQKYGTLSNKKQSQKTVKHNSDDILADINSWSESARVRDNELTQLKEAGMKTTRHLPDIRTIAGSSGPQSLTHQTYDSPSDKEIWESSEQPRETPMRGKRKKVVPIDDLSGYAKFELDAKATNERHKGNDCFRSGDYENALKYYTAATKYAPKDAVLFANRSQANLKLKKFRSAEQDATKAIELDASSMKAFYRRGLARMELSLYEGAIDDFKRCLEISPDQKAVGKELQKAEREWAKNRPKEGFQRLEIEESDDSEEEEEEMKRQGEPAACFGAEEGDRVYGGGSISPTNAALSHRMIIEEVETDSESESEITEVSTKRIVSKDDSVVQISNESDNVRESLKNSNAVGQSLELSSEPKGLAKKAKERGDKAFNAGNFLASLDFYSDALSALNIGNKGDLTNIRQSDREMVKSILLARLQAFRSIRKFEECISNATNFIDHMDSQCARAFFERGCSLKALGRFSEARIDLLKARSLDPVFTVEIDELLLEMPENLNVPQLPENCENSKVGSVISQKEAMTEERNDSTIECAPVTPSTKAVKLESNLEHSALSKTENIKSKQGALEYDAPRSGFEFLKIYNSLKTDLDAFHKYIKNIKPSSLLSLLKDHLSSDILGNVGLVLHKYELKKNPTLCFETLCCLSKTNRFALNVMFLENYEKNVLKKIFCGLRKVPYLDEKSVTKLQKLYSCQ
eukprot:759341_1